MTTTNVTERSITVAGKPIFVAEAGSGPAAVMLHGGGPGASGISNYSRNIDALAQQFRVVVPDLPGCFSAGDTIDEAVTAAEKAAAEKAAAEKAAREAAEAALRAEPYQTRSASDGRSATSCPASRAGWLLNRRRRLRR